jgi:peptidoglycan DL-endopeptidase CwlO
VKRAITTLAAVLLTVAAPVAALAQTAAASKAEPPASGTSSMSAGAARSDHGKMPMASDQRAMTGKAEMSRRRIEELQAALQSNGAQLATDGVWGPKTVAALREFQKEKRLKVTGQLDRQTAKELNIPHWG